MSVLWQRLVAFGFRLLYNELAWLYDPVSWLTSLGRWRRWQRTALAYLPPAGRVLEVAPGPGHLLAELAGAGYQVAGLDLSPAMLRLARRRLAHWRFDVALCRGRAQALPFAAECFDAVVLTFPTPFVYQAEFLAGLARILRSPGRLVVVEVAYFRRHDLAARALHPIGDHGRHDDGLLLVQLRHLRAQDELDSHRGRPQVADVQAPGDVGDLRLRARIAAGGLRRRRNRRAHAVAVDQAGDQSSVDEAGESRVVRLRREAADSFLSIPVSLDVQAMRVVAPASVADRGLVRVVVLNRLLVHHLVSHGLVRERGVPFPSPSVQRGQGFGLCSRYAR